MFSPGKKLYHFLFVITIIALVVFKWNDFSLPYFWDELGVYSRAADYQMHHVISLMPASLPPQSSRGHPLLFTFLNAWAIRIFGEQVLVEHLFCFAVSVLLLYAVYIKVSRYFSPLTGILSVIVLSVQPLFLAQSCLVLPEIMLALFAFMAIFSFYESSFVLFALYASLAILTKEAAIVLPLVVISYAVCRAVLLREWPAALKPYAFTLVLTPYAVFGLFLIIQKQQNGWYFFPLHINHVEFSTNVFFQQIKTFTSFLFWGQGRNVCTIICYAGAVVALLTGKYMPGRAARSFTLMLIIMGLAFLGFNSITDLYMERYLVVVLVAFCILIAIALTSISTNRFVVAGFVILVVFISSQNLETPIFDYDADLSYRHEVNCLQQAVTWVLQVVKPGQEVVGNYPIGYSLTFAAGGYLKGQVVNYRQQDNPSSYYMLIADPGADFHPDSDKDIKTLVKTFNDSYAHVQVYYVRKKDVNGH